jgi:PTS system fructose-specific IIC component
MKILDLLRADFCIMDIKSSDREGAIREMVAALPDSGKILDKARFIRDLLERERLSSTGIGQGVAIPHCPSEGVEGIVIAFARSRTGIDFGSIDGNKVNIVFLIGTNPKEINLYLTVLAKLSKLLIKESFRKELLAAKNGQEILAIVQG